MSGIACGGAASRVVVGLQWPMAACSAEQATFGGMPIAGFAEATGLTVCDGADAAFPGLECLGEGLLGMGFFGAGLGDAGLDMTIPGIFIPPMSCICAAAGIAVMVATRKPNVFMPPLRCRESPRHRDVR
ncbi:hypothetical protein [Sphingomonas sp. Leaf38]|uniref:hypothetical protein n=1 Tax=Sphingomonas sp. Leaf38 TaxID=1736217 RepID=UPI001F3941AB|nr:hypothetical protein [Sphingomonas sp. Leaf38]